MELISFETAKITKEKGYIHPDAKLGSFGYFIENICESYNESGDIRTIMRKYYNPENNHYLAPYQEELKEWFRNEHNLHIIVIPTAECFWTYKIITLAGDIEQPPYKEVCGTDYNTYEEALEAGLQEMLNVI